jgi:glycine betaine/proline transport system permease protein
VILAILLDRITQTIGANSRDKKTHWYEKGPASLVYQLKLKFTHTEGNKKLGEQK